MSQEKDTDWLWREKPKYKGEVGMVGHVLSPELWEADRIAKSESCLGNLARLFVSK